MYMVAFRPTGCDKAGCGLCLVVIGLTLRVKLVCRPGAEMSLLGVIYRLVFIPQHICYSQCVIREQVALNQASYFNCYDLGTEGEVVVYSTSEDSPEVHSFYICHDRHRNKIISTQF